MKKLTLLSIFLVGCFGEESTLKPQDPIPPVIEEGSKPSIQKITVKNTTTESIPLKFKTLSEGSGNALFSASKTPLIRFQIWNQQGSLLAQNKDSETPFPFAASDFLIPGIAEGMLGMKVGEVREIIVSKEKSLEEDLLLSENLSMLKNGEWIRAEIEIVSMD